MTSNKQLLLAAGAAGIIVIAMKGRAAVCVPSWQCKTTLDGYEEDVACGLPDRLNPACNAPISGQGIIINSLPSDMPVVIDRDRSTVWRTPARIYLSPGMHTVGVQGLRGYQSVYAEIDIVANTWTVLLTVLPPISLVKYRCVNGRCVEAWTGMETLSACEGVCGVTPVQTITHGDTVSVYDGRVGQVVGDMDSDRWSVADANGQITIDDGYAWHQSGWWKPFELRKV
jgi:hypothetical protein